MNNINKENNTIDFLDNAVAEFAHGYTELIKFGGENFVLNAALEAYVDSIYKQKISEICDVPKVMISDEILRYIQSGTQSEKLVDNGKLSMYRRSYTDEEIKNIVENKLKDNCLNHHSTDINISGNNEKNDVEQKPVESVSESKPVENTEIVNSDKSDSIESDIIKEEQVLNDETGTILSSDLDVSSIVNENNKIAATDLKVQDLIEKYSNTSASEKLPEAISLIYKTVLSQITGISRDDISDSVCNRVQAGTNEEVADEKGNIVIRRRSLTDEEAKLIVLYTNKMSDEDVERFIGESDTKLGEKTL